MIRAMAALHLLTTDDLDSATLAQTARDAAGGGTVTALAPVGGDAGVWHASVVGSDDVVRDVRLDLRLRTVAVSELRAARAAA
jgi:L-serine deaminase